MFSLTKNLKKKDKRLNFQILIYKNKNIKTWIINFDITCLLNIKNNNLLFFTSNVNNSNNLFIKNTQNNLLYLINSLRVNYLNQFFAVDISNIKYCNNTNLIYIFSCYLTNYKIILISLLNKINILPSYSNIYLNFSWVERELKEFSDLFFNNLKDSRRLLTDYSYSSYINYKDYNTNSYNLIFQDLYIRVLHWYFIYLYIIIIIILSFILYNRSLIQSIFLGELLIILLFFLFITLSINYNIYLLIGLSIILLVFGGLELSLNLLILNLYVKIFFKKTNLY